MEPSQSLSKVEGVILPLLGSRASDCFPFEYLPVEVGPHACRIALPSWVLSREILHLEDQINLHLAVCWEGRRFSGGTITTKERSEEYGSDTYLLYFKAESPQKENIYISFSNPCLELEEHDEGPRTEKIVRQLQECVLLKRGILIYLKHLMPYYSRRLLQSKSEFDTLRSFVFDDIRSRVHENMQKLSYLAESLREAQPDDGELGRFLDLNEVRSAVESELSLDLFVISIEEEASLAYLRSIKQLENRLYSHYNEIVILYAAGL